MTRIEQENALAIALSKAIPELQKAKILELCANAKNLDRGTHLYAVLRNVTFNVATMALKEDTFSKHPISLTILLEEAKRYEGDIFKSLLEIGSLDLFQNADSVVESIDQYIEDGDGAMVSDVVDSVVDGIYFSWVNIIVLWLVDRYVANAAR